MTDLILTNGTVVYEMDEAIAVIQKMYPEVSRDMYERGEADLASDFNQVQVCDTCFEAIEKTKFEERKLSRDKFLTRFPRLDLTLVVDDSDYESGHYGVNASHYNVQEIIENLECLGSLDEFQTEQEVRRAMLDISDFSIQCLPTEEWEKLESIRKAQELESAARKIAAQYGVDISNVPAFLDACQRELERFDSYREGMKEDGLCIGYGVSPETWYEEYDESRSDSENVHKIINWIRENMPLQYAKWQYDKENS